jgi:hypothetical protein
MTDTFHVRREARLRPEFADFFSHVEPGVWMPAAHMVALVEASASVADSLGLHPRVLDSRQFEFRGGPSEVRPPDALTRAYDQ